MSSPRRMILLPLSVLALLIPTACRSPGGDDTAGDDGPQATKVGQPSTAAMDEAMMSGSPPGAGGPVESDAGHFKVSNTSDLDPIEVNQIHDWVLHLETADGSAALSSIRWA